LGTSRHVLERASRLAAALDTSLLLGNDATANPYSFVHVSSGGQQSVVLVDPDELDENLPIRMLTVRSVGV
jgi:hypothetical protein